MYKNIKTRGKVKAKDIKQGRTFWRSGAGGIYKVKPLTKPLKVRGSWVFYCLHGYSDDTFYPSCDHLADNGVNCKGGYNNNMNRLFNTKEQAERWQEFLKVSGRHKKHNDFVRDFIAPIDYQGVSCE